jgi:hypothetical protein
MDGRGERKDGCNAAEASGRDSGGQVVQKASRAVSWTEKKVSESRLSLRALNGAMASMTAVPWLAGVVVDFWLPAD